jgi:hypothetical protein
LFLVIVLLPSPAQAGMPTHTRSGASYGSPGVVCKVTDPRLRELSGLVETGPDVMFAINDKAPALIYRLDDRCRIRSTLSLGVRVRDTEDLAIGPDGSLWVGDIGGNGFPRSAITMFRRMPHGGVAQYKLRYPDGTHDAEAMMISRLNQLVIVTKRRDGRSRMYSARLPLSPVSTLTSLGQLDLRTLRPGRRGSLCVTGGAVSPRGDHFVLRTYTTAFEWDAPGGDIVGALTGRAPRAIPLAPTRQGEAIAYSADGSELLTGTEKLPAPVHRVLIARH